MNVNERFYKKMRQYIFIFICINIMSCVIVNVVNASVAKYNVIIVNRISRGESIHAIIATAIPFFILTIASVLMNFLFFILDLYFPRKATAKSRILLYDKLLILDPMDFSRHNVSEIFNIFGDNISDYITCRYELIRNIVNPVATILIYSVMFQKELEYEYFVLYFFIYVLILFLSKKQIAKIRGYVEEGIQKNNQLSLILNEFFDNYEEIKILHLEESINEKITQYINEQHQLYKKMQRYETAINLLKELPNAVFTILVFVNMYLKILNNQLDIGSYFVVMSIATVYISSFSSIFDAFQKKEEKKMKDKPIDSFFHMRDESIYENDIRFTAADGLNQLSCEKLNFSYGDSSSLYNDLNIHVKKGEVLIIKGASGCGKTTLLKLLSGLYVPDSGDIWYISDSQKYSPAECRYRFGFHLQSSSLFKDTIRNNLTLGEDYPENQIYDVLEKVKLLDVVHNKPDGLEERLGYSGEGLSGGEKQRLALARILLRKPAAVFLDESFSAVDDSASMEIYRNMDVPVTIFCLHRDEFIRDELKDNIIYLELGGEQNE